jgi:hypothetical protein
LASVRVGVISNMLTRPYCLSELLALGEVNSAYGEFTYSERPLTFRQDGDGRITITGASGLKAHVVDARHVCGSILYMVDEWMGGFTESRRMPDGTIYGTSSYSPRELLLVSNGGRRMEQPACGTEDANLMLAASVPSTGDAPALNTDDKDGQEGAMGSIPAGVIVGITVAATAIMAVLGYLFWAITHWQGGCSSRSESKLDSGSLGSSMEGGISADINSATWNLKPSDVQAQLDADGLPVFLGQGAFGVVTQAKLFGVHDVAVKTISHSALDVSYSTFLREVGLLHHISRNRNVVQFYGACQERDSLMIVTELMEGGNLRRALSGDGGAELLWAQRGKEVALDIVRGLCFLHSCKVVHRDMKSSNVLLSKEGTAKICDVGMAVMHEASLSMSVGSIGTFAWAAPELLLGMRCGSKVDIFSTGVILWEIVTGEVPQRGRVFPPEPGPRCPKQLCSIMARCLHVEPSKRPTARELHDLLAACPQR